MYPGCTLLKGNGILQMEGSVLLIWGTCLTIMAESAQSITPQ